VNEKLLGDFIRKHNVRDKIFRKCGLLFSKHEKVLTGISAQLHPSAESQHSKAT
jgi:hypothetical protein